MSFNAFKMQTSFSVPTLLLMDSGTDVELMVLVRHETPLADRYSDSGSCFFTGHNIVNFKLKVFLFVAMAS